MEQLGKEYNSELGIPTLNSHQLRCNTVQGRPDTVHPVLRLSAEHRIPDNGSLDSLDKDADNEVHRWFKLLADIEHNRMPTENEISHQTRLARAEQEGVKRRLRRTAEVYKKQSKRRQ